MSSAEARLRARVRANVIETAKELAAGFGYPDPIETADPWTLIAYCRTKIGWARLCGASPEDMAKFAAFMDAGVDFAQCAQRDPSASEEEGTDLAHRKGD
jgi:hypothetical protein